MKFSINRDKLLEPLTLACGVVERRQTSPVLANVLIVLEDNVMTLTGSDQEVEMRVRIPDVSFDESGEITVPARKLLDICKSLPEGADLNATLDGNRLAVDSGRFSSHLVTLPAVDFPTVEVPDADVTIELRVSELVRLLQRTSFAMAQQDVRYFFNGVLLEVKDGAVRLVATNGQRLASSYVESGTPGAHQFIIPRKAVGELVRILGDDAEEMVQLRFTANHMQVDRAAVTLISKLIDATYPDYSRAIPDGGDKVVQADRQELKEALTRTAILSNELYRNVRLQLTAGRLDMHTNNPQQEEAEETVLLDYDGADLEIGFNVGYLIDALGAMQGEKVKLTFSDAGSACLLEDEEETETLFVISPMVL